MKIPDYIPPARDIAPDTRTRKEIQEDFEKSLADIDIKQLRKLREAVRGMYTLETSDEDNRTLIKEQFDKVLDKYIHTFEKFEELNSEENRKISLKKKELNLEASHDWRAKFRLFLFRVLGSILLVITLFGIGYIESEYEWAKLPMTKYLSIGQKVP